MNLKCLSVPIAGRLSIVKQMCATVWECTWKKKPINGGINFFYSMGKCELFIKSRYTVGKEMTRNFDWLMNLGMGPVGILWFVCQEKYQKTKITRSISTGFLIICTFSCAYVQARYSVCGHDYCKTKFQLGNFKMIENSIRYHVVLLKNISQALSQWAFPPFRIKTTAMCVFSGFCWST